MSTFLQRIVDAFLRFVRHDMSEEEVVKALDAINVGREPLDWRHSIVDLLKLLELDSSLEARKTLATELGYEDPLDGSVEMMNVWLHKEVMKEVAQWGIKIPKEETKCIKIKAPALSSARSTE